MPLASGPFLRPLVLVGLAATVFTIGCTKRPLAQMPPAPAPSTVAGGAYVPATVSNTVPGFQAQIDELVRIGQTGDQTNWQIALSTFSLPNAGSWFEANFAPEHLAQLTEDYPEVRDGHLGHMSWVIGHNHNAPGFRIQVAPSEMPAPSADAGFESLLPRSLHAVPLQNFRLSPTANSGSMPPSWVSSFIYIDGYFRVVGGTYPFWAEKLTPIRGPMSLPPSTVRGMTVQGMAFQHDQKGGRIVGVVQLEIKVDRDGHVSNINVISGDKEFIEDAKKYIEAAQFPAMPDIPQLANAERKWEFEVAFFAPGN